MGGAVRNGAQLLGERYRLIEQLGAGGMSVVWRGYDEVLGRQVAVKVLASRLASDRAFRHRLRAEAQAAARLCHPNITNVYDYGESEQVGLTVPYVVMELVHGGPLSARLGRSGTLSWREAVTVGAEVSSALATAHARGVVHRDVTPGNVMLTSTGVKVVDFGISALAGESEKGAEGTLLGTPAYLAPERLDNGQVSPATDVYALGLLLYRMLTGRLPWQASTTTQMLRAHMYAEPEPMPEVPGLPAEVADLVRRCLAKRPEDRPATAEVASTLAEAAGMHATVPVPSAPGAVDPAQLDPAVLANAGTTILPWSTETGMLPFPGRTRSRRAVARRRRVEAGVAAAGLIAVIATMWGVTSRSPASGGIDRPTEARMGLTGPPPCAVDYALRKDSGKDFIAELTLTNTSGRELRDWTMSFAFPGQQTVTKTDPAVRQQGRTVEVRPAAGQPALAPGAARKVALTGRYTGTNPLPLEFRLGDAECRVRVSGVAGTVPTTKPTAKAPAKPSTKKATVAKAGSSGGSGSGGGSKAQPDKPEKPGRGGKQGKGK
ncbi:serine/threonine protein kinase [Micromonospora sp. ATCC 39149]|uniref:non-specific serine/threonine protein kinase n=1 Tax=Micromonospora carbonacea TaxID=47853 RepID=A0A7D5YCK2_9ACTN|nr:serine/threonine-protein kinase [Micromonospora sp. ATCC 39149]EEP71853.1 serine/threonine protein kinase [Micromonospora sp. ATCC 39149]QLJ98073.1 protein kinase [Micromonospora carbonacea]